MRRSARFLTLLAAATLALAPVVADARPGGGSSSGSRGSRTYSAPPSTTTAPSGARQFDRTQQPQSAPRPSSPSAMPGQMRPQGGFFARNPFMGGLMAGLLGAGLFGLLAGGGFFGGLGSMAGLLGFLLQIAVIAGIVALVVGFLRRRAQPAPAGLPNAMMREGTPQPAMMGGSSGGRGAARPDELGLGEADFQSFERTLVEVNAAWTREDVAALSRLATPEMVQYFRDDYAALAQRGWKNETRDVRLEKGDLAEAWSEGPRDYATVAMRFSLIDVTRDLRSGAVTEGDPNGRTEALEFWTFVRVQGGPWTLSAIQQAGAA